MKIMKSKSNPVKRNCTILLLFICTLLFPLLLISEDQIKNDKSQTSRDGLQPAPAKSKTDSGLSKLLGLQEKLESRIFSEKDLKKCRKLLKKTKDEGLRRNLSIVLSRYERELCDKPLPALEYIAPEVLARARSKRSS